MVEVNVTQSVIANFKYSLSSNKPMVTLFCLHKYVLNKPKRRNLAYSSFLSGTATIFVASEGSVSSASNSLIASSSRDSISATVATPAFSKAVTTFWDMDMTVPTRYSTVSKGVIPEVFWPLVVGTIIYITNIIQINIPISRTTKPT